MTIQVALHHRIDYRHDRSVSPGPHLVRLRPAPHVRTPILAHSLKIEPSNHFMNWLPDPQGNFLARVVFPEKISHLAVTVDLVADMTVPNPFDFILESSTETVPFEYEGALEQDPLPCRNVSSTGSVLQRHLCDVDKPSGRTMDFLAALNHRIRKNVRYIVRPEPGTRSPEETLALGSDRVVRLPAALRAREMVSGRAIAGWARSAVSGAGMASRSGSDRNCLSPMNRPIQVPIR